MPRRTKRLKTMLVYAELRKQIRRFKGIPAPLAVAAIVFLVAAAAVAAPPTVGDTAPDFTLKTLDGKNVKLSTLTKKSAVVLVVLRGYPGYQCPICTLQVGDLKNSSMQFAAKRVPVILVYPGPAQDLQQHAGEFAPSKELPKFFAFVTDPDYTFVNRYALRWDAPGETAYPSTFVINKQGKIVFAKTSRSHGGRATASEILAAIPKE